MEEVLTGDIWARIAKEINGARRRFAAVAYVSSIQALRFRRSDVLICDASDRAIRSGETSARILRRLASRGVELYSYPNLHAKAVVFGRAAIVGSCNLSASSADQLTELAILTNRRQTVAQVTAFVHGVREIARHIDESFLRRISRLHVAAKPRRGRRKARTTQPLGNKVWFVAVKQLAENKYPQEAALAARGEKRARALLADTDADVSWIRWTGKSRFRGLARPGDMVIQILESLSGKRFRVYEPCAIVYRQDAHHWTRFYVAELEGCRSMPWKRFQKATNSLGIRKLSTGTVRELKAPEVVLTEQVWR